MAVSLQPVAVQLAYQASTNRYGTEHHRGRGRIRPLATRNGLPETRPYTYRGTGQSMTPAQAERLLTRTSR